MDSLLENYASSDKEEQKQHSKPLALKSEAEEEQDFPSKSTSRPGGFFSSFPIRNSFLLNSFPLPNPNRFLAPMPKRITCNKMNKLMIRFDKVVSSNVGFVNDQSGEMNYDNSSWSLGSKSTTNYSAIESVHGENVTSAVVSSIMENDGGGVNSNLESSEVKSDELNYDYSGRIQEVKAIIIIIVEDNFLALALRLFIIRSGMRTIRMTRIMLQVMGIIVTIHGMRIIGLILQYDCIS